MTVKRRDGVRYVTPEGNEVEFQPGSRGRILRNRLGITKKSDMDRAEYEALLKAHGNKGHTIYPHYHNLSTLRNTQFIDRNA